MTGNSFLNMSADDWFGTILSMTLFIGETAKQFFNNPNPRNSDGNHISS